MPKEEKIKKQYQGHRERLRKRFEKSGFKGFQDYEILELLLSLVRPRRDVKPVAKELLNKFKSFNSVLNTDISELKKLKGFTERTAQYFVILRETISYYMETKAKNDEIQFTKISDLVKYLKATIGSKKREILKVLYLNSTNKLIETEEISEGTVNESNAFPRKIVEGTIKYNATSVILAHNHPGGIAEPSENDVAITKIISDALKSINVKLQDHIIISDEGYFGFKREGLLD